MAYVAVPEGLPGISSLFVGYPKTGQLLSLFAEALLRGPSPLAPGERELIAAHVSSLNECVFCTSAHSAVARCMADRAETAQQAIEDPERAPIDEKLKALLAIAGKVQQSGRLVAEEDVERARGAGANDEAIHDTVLIAAAFCMFNRYVDGLATWTPEDPALYEQMGIRLRDAGYAGARPHGAGAPDAEKHG